MISSQISDMMLGVKNMIEAADIRTGDQVLLLADCRSDPMSMEALTAGLKMHGAIPMSLITEPISRYGHVPDAVLQAMHASDVAIWVWPVFITFTPDHRAMGRKREESGTQLQERRIKPYFVYFEGTPGLLARDYAKFPNKVMWKLAEKVREVVASGTQLSYPLSRAYELQIGREVIVKPFPSAHGALSPFAHGPSVG